jgi:hypothetical protein
LLVSGNAIAQTTISGELRVNLKSTEASVPTGTTTASNGQALQVTNTQAARFIMGE